MNLWVTRHMSQWSIIRPKFLLLHDIYFDFVTPSLESMCWKCIEWLLLSFIQNLRVRYWIDVTSSIQYVVSSSIEAIIKYACCLIACIFGTTFVKSIHIIPKKQRIVCYAIRFSIRPSLFIHVESINSAIECGSVKLNSEKNWLGNHNFAWHLIAKRTKRKKILMCHTDNWLEIFCGFRHVEKKRPKIVVSSTKKDSFISVQSKKKRWSTSFVSKQSFNWNACVRNEFHWSFLKFKYLQHSI